MPCWGLRGSRRLCRSFHGGRAVLGWHGGTKPTESWWTQQNPPDLKLDSLFQASFQGKLCCDKGAVRSKMRSRPGCLKRNGVMDCEVWIVTVVIILIYIYIFIYIVRWSSHSNLHLELGFQLGSRLGLWRRATAPGPGDPPGPRTGRRCGGAQWRRGGASHGPFIDELSIIYQW